jgi:predicted membrane-bound mannosyltransferase
MQPNAPDMIDLRMRLFVAIVGAALMVVAWLEYWL